VLAEQDGAVVRASGDRERREFRHRGGHGGQTGGGRHAGGGGGAARGQSQDAGRPAQGREGSAVRRAGRRDQGGGHQEGRQVDQGHPRRRPRPRQQRRRLVPGTNPRYSNLIHHFN